MTKNLDYVYRLLEKTTQKRNLALLTLMSVVVMGLVIATVMEIGDVSDGAGVIDFFQGYSLETVNATLQAYGEEGLNLYARVQLLDVLNPLLYSLTVASFVYMTIKNTRHKWLSITPLAGGLFDYLENIFIYLMTSSYPNISNNAVLAGSTLSIVKNSISVLMVVSIAYAVYVAIQRRRSNEEAARE